MKIGKLPAQFQDVVRNNNSMSTYLYNLNEGRKATPHSWLYETETSDTTLDRWIPIMEKSNMSSPFGEEFIQFDRKQLSKFGPQGEVPPVHSQEALDVLEPMFTPSDYDNEHALSKLFPDAENFGKYLFGPRCQQLRSLSFERTVESMRVRDTLSTNSGFPRFARRNSVVEEEISDAKSGRAFDYPAIVLFRQYNGKLRPVWMYPMSMNLLELAYEQPLKSRLLTSAHSMVQTYVTPWVGYDAVKLALTKLWKPRKTICGGDTSKMDAHMRAAQMRLFFEIAKYAFQRSEWDNFYRAVMRTVNIPLIISQTEMIVGPHGLASGAGFTQISETFLTMFLAYLNKVEGMGIGDDFCWIANMSKDDIVQKLSLLGLPANSDKQEVSNDYTVFLQRMNRRGFFSRDNQSILGGYYPTIRALNSLLNPEKYHSPKKWNSNMFCARCYMILENCIDDPCFSEFLKFVVNGQKDLLPFAKQSAKVLNRISKQARLIPGLSPSYNQEKLGKPLSQFTSILMASEM